MVRLLTTYKESLGKSVTIPNRPTSFDVVVSLFKTAYDIQLLPLRVPEDSCSVKKSQVCGRGLTLNKIIGGTQPSDKVTYCVTYVVLLTCLVKTYEDVHVCLRVLSSCGCCYRNNLQYMTPQHDLSALRVYFRF
jgi:hypothetical protein